MSSPVLFTPPPVRLGSCDPHSVGYWLHGVINTLHTQAGDLVFSITCLQSLFNRSRLVPREYPPRGHCPDTEPSGGDVCASWLSKL